MDETFWRQIIENNYSLPADADLLTLTDALLDYLALPDALWRDTIGYGILARWIIVYRLHTARQLHQMVQSLLPQLTIGIGEQNTDGVFLRSYSASVLALVMYRDTREQFLDPADVQTIAQEAGRYLLAEQDARAFVPGKGFANACGHTADLLRYLAYNDSLDAPDLHKMLAQIRDKLTLYHKSPFTHDEDDRLAKATIAIFGRSTLEAYEVVEWLETFNRWKIQSAPPVEYDAAYALHHHNTKIYLRALYTQIRLSTQRPRNVGDIMPVLMETMRQFSL